MPRKLILVVLLLSSAYSLHAADPFTGLAEKKYDAPIVARLDEAGEKNEKEVLSLLQELPEDEQARHVSSLFAMFGPPVVREARSGVLRRVAGRRSLKAPGQPVASSLIRIARGLHLQSHPIAKNAFFNIPGMRDSRDSMLFRMISDDFPVEHIGEWFQEGGAEVNEERMVEFLNCLKFPIFDPEQKIRALCDAIEFNAWGKVDCHPRWIINQTFDMNLQEKLKNFFSRHGVEFTDKYADDFKEHRSLMLDNLISKYIEAENEVGLTDALIFLAENRAVGCANGLLYSGIIGLKDIFREKGKVFELDPKVLCAYVCSTSLLPGRVHNDVITFLTACRSWPVESFVQAIETMRDEPSFAVFLERSREALMQYAAGICKTPEAVAEDCARQSIPMNSEEFYLSEVRRGIIEANYISILLDTHVFGKYLYGMSLEHCAGELVQDDVATVSFDSQPSCSYQN